MSASTSLPPQQLPPLPSYFEDAGLGRLAHALVSRDRVSEDEEEQLNWTVHWLLMMDNFRSMSATILHHVAPSALFSDLVLGPVTHPFSDAFTVPPSLRIPPGYEDTTTIGSDVWWQGVGQGRWWSDGSSDEEDDTRMASPAPHPSTLLSHGTVCTPGPSNAPPNKFKAAQQQFGGVVIQTTSRAIGATVTGGSKLVQRPDGSSDATSDVDSDEWEVNSCTTEYAEDLNLTPRNEINDRTHWVQADLNRPKRPIEHRDACVYCLRKTTRCIGPSGESCLVCHYVCKGVCPWASGGGSRPKKKRARRGNEDVLERPEMTAPQDYWGDIPEGVYREAKERIESLKRKWNSMAADRGDRVARPKASRTKKVTTKSRVAAMNKDLAGPIRAALASINEQLDLLEKAIDDAPTLDELCSVAAQVDGLKVPGVEVETGAE
ncbi:hypothetical protein CONPUDRAFT_160720 [Coniophora puteana RWD-64-598 SS2]|uniref:Uncharacterized protein n=1 Tax=Coniophora puteana (strain RWD-64-598) TaxID=741705 RepID=R7SFC8_CONPW|nr:uncharacterized protein CONPUDRAFT_160720 [Coniophora puteana RWD-64-598 SS2]EIW73779.1 hypothetical protein CONPUDRAFT_160720 [Coniophora puteana RWD-64-598 SS2]